MRKLISGLVGAGLLISHTAGAACVPSNDREALDVAGLKSQLMVQTLTCKNDNEYNAFINKFKSELNADERVASGYFSHTYGRNGQKRQDEYLTLLANSKADTSQKDGSRFCAHNEDIFKQVLALNNGAELKEFAAGRTTGQPPGMQECEGSATTPTHPRAGRGRPSSTRRSNEPKARPMGSVAPPRSYFRMISTRRFCGSRTPAAVGTNNRV